MSEKTCSKCKTVKEFGLFTRCKKSKDGYGSWCKSCNNKRTKDKYWADLEVMRSKDRKRHQNNKSVKNEKSRKYYCANKDKYRNYHLKKCYGIKQVDYEMMLNYQQHKCAICNEQLGEKLFVDHNHSTGQVRGLLCSECNSALGYIKESRQILENMIDYLTDYPAQFIPIKRTKSCLI
jgi:hypothetical protein